jgi:hypothetical protein
MEIAKEYERIAMMFRMRFSKGLIRRDPMVVDVLMILVFSLLMGWDTLSEVSQRLGIGKDRLYGTLKELSIETWHKLFTLAYEEHAMQALLEAQSMSPATQSRLDIVLSVDDSGVGQKVGKLLSYLGIWWSGQFHRMLNGQDVVMVVLKIGEEVIPVGLWLMSLTARWRDRHARVGLLLEDLAERWKSVRIDISRIPVTMDAGFADGNLIRTVRRLGFFKVVMGVRGEYVLYPGRSKKHSHPLKELLTQDIFPKEPGWACTEPVACIKGVSPTFGKVKACARFMLGKVRRVFAFGIYRDCEILHVWKNHHWVEELFKRLKHLLSRGSYRLQGKSGTHASLIIPLLTYFVLLMLQKSTGRTFEILLRAINQLAYTDIAAILKCWNIEAFEIHLVQPDAMLC